MSLQILFYRFNLKHTPIVVHFMYVACVIGVVNSLGMWLVNKGMFYTIYSSTCQGGFSGCMYDIHTVSMWFGVYWNCDCVAVAGQYGQIERRDCSIWKQSIRMILSVDLSKRSYHLHLHCNGENVSKLHVVVSSNLVNITGMSLSLKPNDYNLGKSICQIDYILLVVIWLPVRTQEVSLSLAQHGGGSVPQWHSDPLAHVAPQDNVSSFSQAFKHLTWSVIS